MFKNITNSVSGWLGGIKPDDENTEAVDSEGKTVEVIQQTQNKEKTEEKADLAEAADDNTGTTTEDLQQQIDEFSAKAVSTAKEWGTWLYDVGKNATTEIAKTAKTLKDTVEEKTIIGDFQHEQTKFVEEKKEKKSKSDAAVPPWVGYNEEESMKQQILALSQDKRNFLRNPPAGVQFNFDYEATFPSALATLQEDEELKNMRFELVPKQVKEEMFWRNYFYRVSLIKQSAQLTTLAQQTGAEAEKKQDTKPIDNPDEEVTVREISAAAVRSSDKPEAEEMLPSSSPPDNEFISDAFQSSQFNEEDLKKDLQMLGVTDKDKTEDIPEWERELQAELQEYEVVDQDQDADLNDEALEQEILQQIEDEAKH